MRTRSDATRVTHVLTSLEIGGAEMVVVRLIGALDATAVRSQVICLRRLGPLATPLTERGVPVENLAVPGHRGALALASALRKAVLRDPPDVIHTHNVSPFVAAGLALTGVPGVGLVHTKHGRSTAVGLAGRAALRHAARRATVIAAVSDDAARQAIEVEGFPRDRVRVIRNGVAVGPPPHERPRTCRAITVARLEAVKDQATMLRAARLVVDHEPRFHLDIVGDGAERGALESLAAELRIGEHVTFHGFRDDVRAFLDASDVFVLSSVSEGISLTLLEAMSAGLPIVATAVGGNAEVVADRTTGILVPPGDPRAMASAIIELVGDPGRAASYGVAGRARVESEFSSTATVAAYLEAYRLAAR